VQRSRRESDLATVTGNLGPNAVELRELCSYVQETSPVRDVLASGVPVATPIEVLA
jgi:hypothetical protein